jgi:hypothetical protein
VSSPPASASREVATASAWSAGRPFSAESGSGRGVGLAVAVAGEAGLVAAAGSVVDEVGAATGTALGSVRSLDDVARESELPESAGVVSGAFVAMLASVWVATALSVWTVTVGAGAPRLGTSPADGSAKAWQAPAPTTTPSASSDSARRPRIRMRKQYPRL